MSNSKLVTYTAISPNKTSPRNHAIDTITIHCVGGNCTLETIGKQFATYDERNGASSNYGIDSNGNVGMYVEESDRSWCTSWKPNDHRAVTIEVANDGPGPQWHVSDKAMATLIKLIADIAKRNNIKKMLWKNDPNLMGQVDKQNMSLHRWKAAKACPGDYLVSKHYFIADEVNKILNGSTDNDTTNNDVAITTSTSYEVVIKVDALNVRKGPGITYPVVTTLVRDKNTYTIVEETNDSTGMTWCKLKSGIGWISKTYVAIKK